MIRDCTQSSDPRADRARLIGFAAVILLAGAALAATAGPPRLPAAMPQVHDVIAVLTASTLPLEQVGLLLVDVAWALWTWIALSMLLQTAVAVAQIAARGAAWIDSMRRVVDRLSVPVVRRAVAAAFAVQVLTRGVPVAAAQTLPPPAAAVVLEATSSAKQVGNADADPQLYTVQAGDTLWAIAQRAYGAGDEYRRILDANVGRVMLDGRAFSPNGVIRPGWQLRLPGATFGASDTQGWYEVRPGDTLSSIAKSTLGDSTRWPEVFELNSGATSPDGRHVLSDPDLIWPGLRLQLPGTAATADQASEDPSIGAPAADAPSPDDLRPAQPLTIPDSDSGELVAAGAAPQPSIVARIVADPPSELPPLIRTPHALDPIVLEPADVPADPTEVSPPENIPASTEDQPIQGPPASSPGDSLQTQIPVAPFIGAGLGVLTIAGLAYGAHKLRKLRRLRHEPESEVVVEGGFAEAQLAHDLTRGLHGVGFDPVATVVGQVEQFLFEYNGVAASVVAVRHGNSSTTISLRCGLAEQAILVDLAPVFAERVGAEVEACISADQDVLWQLVRLRKTRLLPTADSLQSSPCLVPLGVLFDRQVFFAAWRSLGHVLVASLPAQGAETILTSLIATLTSRRSPEQMQMWLIASDRAIPAPLYELPHLSRIIDPTDTAALETAITELRSELDRRATSDPAPVDLTVVIPQLAQLGECAAQVALLATTATDLRVRFVVASSDPDAAVMNPLTAHCTTRMVLRMQTEESSVALLGVADATLLGAGGRLMLRLDGREPVELYGYQVAPEHLERLVKVMRSAYPAPAGVPLQDPPNAAVPAAQSAVDDDDRLVPSGVMPVVEPDQGIAAPTDEPPSANSVGPCEPTLQIFCLGSPRVLCAGEQVWPRLGGGDAKPWELLLYLAIQPPEGVARDAVVSALWPEEDLSEDAAHRFRQMRYRLRRQLQTVPGAPESDGICADRRALRLDPCLVWSDAQEFLSLVRSARTNPGGDIIRRLERARELYVGDLLNGPEVRRYAWIDERDDSGVTMREHFRRLFQTASERLAELYADVDDIAAAIDVYRELTDIDPSDDQLWQALFRLHARCGDRNALVDEEQRMRQALRDMAEELDVPLSSGMTEPSAETVQEFQRLLADLPEPLPATA